MNYSVKIKEMIEKSVNKAEQSLLKLLQANDTTEFELFVNKDDDKYDGVYDDVVEDALRLQELQCHALGHDKHGVRLVRLTKIELKKNGDKTEVYAYAESEDGCCQYEGDDVELMLESYWEMMNFIEQKIDFDRNVYVWKHILKPNLKATGASFGTFQFVNINV